MRNVVYYAQELLYNLTPYIPMYSRKYHNAYAPGLQCWTELLGYGSNNDWTYNYINWKKSAGVPDPTKPSWRFHISGPLAKLNPMTSSSAYDWQVMNRLFDGLLDMTPYTFPIRRPNTNPQTLTDILWAAKTWDPRGSYYPYVNPGEEVYDGMYVKFVLRPGIKWQDGQVFDANDVLWNWDFIDSIEPSRHYDIYKNYVRSEVSTTNYADDTITLYINATSLWLIYSFTDSALLVPPHIYGPYGPVDTNLDGVVTYTEVNAFKPYQTPHPTVPGLTCLIGTGAWIFKEWNILVQTVRLDANTAYWAGTFRREDITMDGRVNLFDAVMVALSGGAGPTSPSWYSGAADLNCDYIVNLFDAVLLAGKAGTVTLP